MANYSTDIAELKTEIDAACVIRDEAYAQGDLITYMNQRKYVRDLREDLMALQEEAAQVLKQFPEKPADAPDRQEA